MQNREKWGSRIGIILAVAGSAVGLGNFLRFPGQACQNGGGAFMIPYFISFLLLGIPLCWIEWTLGRYGGQFSHGSLPGIFDSVTKKKWGKYVGVLGLFVPLVIFFYYTYLESWCLGYSIFSLVGKYSHISDPKEMSGFLSAFQGLTKNSHFNTLGIAYGCFVLTFVVNMIVIYKGLAKGIEFICKIAVPILIAGGLFLMIRILTLGTPDPSKVDLNVTNALGFMWNPDFAALSQPKVWLAAAGQIFFTLSVGLGAIMTYASYLRKNDDIALSSTTAAGMNELFEVVIGGSIVIPAAYLFLGPELTLATAQKGVFDLGFVTMPIVLNKIPFGDIFGFYWFFLLFLAGITSSISLMQPIISFLEDEFGWNRHKSALALGIVCFVVAHACIFGLGAGVLDEFDFWGGTLAITICAFVEVMIFIIYIGPKRGWELLHRGADIKIPDIFRYLFYITPFYLGAILLYWALFNWVPWIVKPFGIDMSIGWINKYPWINITQKVCEKNPLILYTRGGLLLLIALLLAMIFTAWKLKKNKGGAK
ncbi:MAG: sodium:calcium symporter [Chlamydiae bacterium]|nr:MAG: sodium:calcium symporter [Chlamydiota bacterium]